MLQRRRVVESATFWSRADLSDRSDFLSSSFHYCFTALAEKRQLQYKAKEREKSTKHGKMWGYNGCEYDGE